MTFDNYCTGRCNRMAYLISRAVVEEAEPICDFLVLEGMRGTGKTHLLHAIAHYARLINPDWNIICATARDFTDELIDAIQSGTMMGFRTKYRNADLLLIDNVECIAGRFAAEEEFFCLLDDLIASQKIVVVTVSPRKMYCDEIEYQIRKQLQRGITITLDLPDLETRKAILQTKAESYGMILDDDTCALIAEEEGVDGSWLEGAIQNYLEKYSVRKKNACIGD